MKIELKNIKIYEQMSEETTAFSADIYVGGKKAGYAKNDGRGGCNEYHAYSGCIDTIRAAEQFLTTQPDIVYPSINGEREFSVKSNMENWIDFQIANKEKEKYEKKLAKDCLTGICYGGHYSYSKSYWKGYTIAQMLANPVGKNLIQKKVDELKSKGVKIFNTNLTGIEL